MKEIVVMGLIGVFVLTSVIGADPNIRQKERDNGKTTLIVDCPHDDDTTAAGDTIYTDTGGLNFSGGSYTPKEPMHGILLCYGGGDIGVYLKGGGKMVFEVVVDSGKTLELFRNYRIATIDSATTTFSGKIYPLF